ncbi:MAG: hypothetical protein K8H89_04500 [Flavobacteriales bacterium]|nr:hypothetical protein [Flavobacteriales bacterium]
MEVKTTRPAFVAMPAHSRVWAYKSATAFTPEQQALIRERGEAFTGQWTSHGDDVAAAFALLDGHFVVIAADLQDMKLCGGAIDASVQFIQALEQELGLTLTDRMVVLFEKDGTVRSCRVPEVEDLLRSGTLTADTIVFDDLVATKADMDARFRTPLRNTWMARYL